MTLPSQSTLPTRPVTPRVTEPLQVMKGLNPHQDPPCTAPAGFGQKTGIVAHPLPPALLPDLGFSHLQAPPSHACEAVQH